MSRSSGGAARSQVTPKPYTQPHPTLLIGGGVEAAARRAARLRLPMMPMNEDARLAEWYADEAAKTGFEGGFVMAPSGPTFVHVSHDPERAWEEIAPYVMYEAQTYAGFQTGGQHSTPMVDAETLDDLKNSPQYLVGTPDQVVEAAGQVSPMGALDVQPARRWAAAGHLVGEPRAVRLRGDAAHPAAGVAAVAIDPRAPVIVGVGAVTEHATDADRRARRVRAHGPRRPSAPMRTPASPGVLGRIDLVLDAPRAPGRTATRGAWWPSASASTRCAASSARSASSSRRCSPARRRRSRRRRRRRAGVRRRGEAPGVAGGRRPASSSTTRIRRRTDPDEVLAAGGRHPQPHRDRAGARGARAPVRDDRERDRPRRGPFAGRAAPPRRRALGPVRGGRGAATRTRGTGAVSTRTRSAPPAPDNRAIAMPYTKLLCSQWNVDQAAAIVVMAPARPPIGSASRRDRRVFAHAAAESNQMVPLPYRAEIHRWPAFEAVVDALGLTDPDAAPPSIVDLYSCFPAAVQVQARALGLPLDVAADRVRRHDVRRRPAEPLGAPGDGPARAPRCARRRTRSGSSTSVSGMITKPGASLWSATPPRRPVPRHRRHRRRRPPHTAVRELLPDVDRPRHGRGPHGRVTTAVSRRGRSRSLDVEGGRTIARSGDPDDRAIDDRGRLGRADVEIVTPGAFDAV